MPKCFKHLAFDEKLKGYVHIYNSNNDSACVHGFQTSSAGSVVIFTFSVTVVCMFIKLKLVSHEIVVASHLLNSYCLFHLERGMIH